MWGKNHVDLHKDRFIQNNFDVCSRPCRHLFNFSKGDSELQIIIANNADTVPPIFHLVRSTNLFLQTHASHLYPDWVVVVHGALQVGRQLRRVDRLVQRVQADEVRLGGEKRGGGERRENSHHPSRGELFNCAA